MARPQQYEEVEKLIQEWEIDPPPAMQLIQTWIGTKDGFTPEQLAWDGWQLDETSIVFEVGGHNGRFTSEMILRYQPIIYFFEPSPRAFEFARKIFKDYPRIKMFNFGLGDRTGAFAFGNDAKHGGSFLSGGEPVIQAELVDIVEFLSWHNITRIDFMQINIEGGEHFLLPHMINNGILDIVQKLMLHWHTRADLAVCQSIITGKMLETHKITRAWSFQCWEKRKNE